MRICLVCVEIFAWGKYGGFGRATRMIGRELAHRGVEVYAVVPRRDGQRPVEELDGITVLGFPYYYPWAARKLYRECDADIYHSQEPSFGTVLAMKEMPDRKHIITFRDPKDQNDRSIEMRYPSRSRIRTLLASLYENAVVAQSVQRADRLFCCSPHLGLKVRDMFGLSSVPEFLPSPILIPKHPMKKAARPTVCFLARWDRRKRPERFFELAIQNPEVRFIAVGKSQDPAWDKCLRNKYRDVPNLKMPGFIDQFETDALSNLLEECWILVNTAAREGLPTAFLEALAHQCALLSGVNPDGIVERFGCHVEDGDFSKGLRRLLESDGWRQKGTDGHQYVKESFGLEMAVDRHMAVYSELIGEIKKPGGRVNGVS
jgi:glycosyltransferase involved in cell wall biosynthesis